MSRPANGWTPGPTSRRSDLPIAEGELDDDLGKLVRRTSWLRQGFYFVVLIVALAGQVSGAVEALGIPLFAAIPAVAALELGGIVVLANADVRRRLGEKAFASRLLSAAIAASAVAFNWLAHSDHLLGGFFAGMSALGYLVWLMHTENQRRDRLRVKGDLPPTTPSYEIVGHWLHHPWLTVRAKAMAKADPSLGLYDSMAAARAEVKRERRQSAIAKVLHRKIKSAVDPRTADIAIAVYDLDEIAGRLAERADYDGLTAIIAADLAPHKLTPNGVLEEHQPRGGLRRSIGSGSSGSKANGSKGSNDSNGSNGKRPNGTAINGANGHPLNGRSLNGALAIEFSHVDDTDDVDPDRDDAAALGETLNGALPAIRPVRAQSNGTADPEPADPEPAGTEPIRAELNGADASGMEAVPVQPLSDDVDTVASRAAALRRTTRRTGSLPIITPDLRQDVERALRPARSATPAPRPAAEPEPDDTAPLWDDPAADARSLRRRVHAALDAAVRSGDQRDDDELIGEIFDQLHLDSSERVAASSYVHSWRSQRLGAV